MKTILLAGDVLAALCVACGGGDDGTVECTDECYPGSYNTMDFFNNENSSGSPLAPIDEHRCIDGDLYLEDALDDSMSGDLPCLEEVGGDLDVSHNTYLTNLDILGGLTSVGGALVIQENPALPYCAICPLLQQLTAAPQSTTFSGNLQDSCWDGATLTCP